MQIFGMKSNFELNKFIAEASHALATLDADRLEEMAASCCVLNREPALIKMQMHDTAAEIDIFANVLEATRANLEVMRSLCEQRNALLEYRKICLVESHSVRRKQKTRSYCGDN